MGTTFTTKSLQTLRSLLGNKNFERIDKVFKEYNAGELLSNATMVFNLTKFTETPGGTKLYLAIIPIHEEFPLRGSYMREFQSDLSECMGNKDSNWFISITPQFTQWIMTISIVY